MSMKKISPVIEAKRAIRDLRVALSAAGLEPERWFAALITVIVVVLAWVILTVGVLRC